MDEITPAYQASGRSSGYAPPQAPSTRPLVEFNPPKFAVEHPIKSESTYESMMTTLGNVFGACGQVPFLFCCPNPFKEVPQGSIGLVSRFGRYYKTGDPGLVRVNPFTEKIRYVNTTIQVASIGPVPIVTKDNVTVGIESVLYWHVTDPYLATYGVANVSQALIERTQTTLRAVLGGRDLQDMIENRDTIASAITEIIDKPAHNWGVTVESILIKDIVLSHELQTSLSSAATQKRIGESKVIQAKAEVDAALLMREAAEILNTPAAMQIRTLDSMVLMSRAANTKVMFVPINQDYSSGSINAFGGAGATVGVNTYPSGDGNSGEPAAEDKKRTVITVEKGRDEKSGGGSNSLLHDSVKDAAVYAQLVEM
ncbi:hypothetical protein GQ54DRAFT_292382 [Martensiomyces pterosporus]|nr:hypothetical protein GQ54DRAFT_292382 [Martensiomyces pterosporus]